MTIICGSLRVIKYKQQYTNNTTIIYNNNI